MAKFRIVCKAIFLKMVSDNKYLVFVIMISVSLGITGALFAANLIGKVVRLSSDNTYTIYTELSIEEARERINRLDKKMFFDSRIIADNLSIGDLSAIYVAEGGSITHTDEILAGIEYINSNIIGEEVEIGQTTYTVVGIHVNYGFFLPFENADSSLIAEEITVQTKLNAKEEKVRSKLSEVFFDSDIAAPKKESFLLVILSSNIFIVSTAMIIAIFLSLSMCYMYLLSTTKKEIMILSHLGYSYPYLAIVMTIAQFLLNTLCFVLGAITFFVIERVALSVSVIELTAVYFRLSFMHYLSIWSALMLVLTIFLIPYINNLCSGKPEVRYD